MQRVWRTIEQAPASAAAFAWKQWLDSAFDLAATVCLRRTERRAKAVPCPAGCGCGHRVVPAGAHFLGVCDCDEAGCEDLRLTADDLAVWELDGGKLGRALARAWDLDGRQGELRVNGAVEVGSFGGAALAVVLAIAREQSEFERTLLELVARMKERFVVLAPTARFFNGTARELLANAKAGFFDLESEMDFTAAGRLQAHKSAGELFSKYLAGQDDPIRKTEAQRIFELFIKLGTNSRVRKARLEDVFRLAILEGLSQKETAKRCKCVPSLVSARVTEIEKRFGRSVEQLRNYASDIRERAVAVKGEQPHKRKHGAPVREGES